MKTFVFATLIAFCLFSQAAAEEDDLAAKWKLMIRKSAAEARVDIEAAPTATANGVHVMVPSLSMLKGEGDDPALQLYLKCYNAFSKWGKGQKTLSSTGQSGEPTKEYGVSDGGHFILRFKYENGDYMGLTYLARSRDGSSAPTLMITYVDHDKFTGETPESEGDGLRFKWEQIRSDAAEGAKVFIKSARTGIFEGTYTFLSNLSLGYRTEGDAALALYNECKFKFDAWSEEDGATIVPGGAEEEAGGKDAKRKNYENRPVLKPRTGAVYLMQYLASNGDYLCLKYRAPRADGSEAEFRMFYVDRSEFVVPGAATIENTQSKK